MNPVLHEHLTYLKLTDIAAQCEALATDAAKGWTYVDYLRRLLEGNMKVTYLAGSNRECHSHERES